MGGKLFEKYVCSLSPLYLNLITQSVMTRHAEILNAFKSRFDIDPPPEVDQDLTYLKMILIKACDVSNEIRPPAVAEPWVERLLQEYFVQVCISIMNATLHFIAQGPKYLRPSTSQIISGRWGKNLWPSQNI